MWFLETNILSSIISHTGRTHSQTYFWVHLHIMRIKSGLASTSVSIFTLFPSCIASLSLCTIQESIDSSGRVLVASLSLHVAEFGLDICETAFSQLQEACPGVKIHTNILGNLPFMLVGNFCYLRIHVPPSQGACIDIWLQCYVRDLDCVRPSSKVHSFSLRKEMLTQN